MGKKEEKKDKEEKKKQEKEEEKKEKESKKESDEERQKTIDALNKLKKQRLEKKEAEKKAKDTAVADTAVVKTELGFVGVKESCAEFAKTVVKIMADAMKVDASKVEAKPASDCSDEDSVGQYGKKKEKKYKVTIRYADNLEEAKKAADISSSELKAAVKKSVEKVGASAEVGEVKAPEATVEKKVVPKEEAKTVTKEAEKEEVKKKGLADEGFEVKYKPPKTCGGMDNTDRWVEGYVAGSEPGKIELIYTHCGQHVMSPWLDYPSDRIKVVALDAKTKAALKQVAKDKEKLDDKKEKLEDKKIEATGKEKKKIAKKLEEVKKKIEKTKEKKETLEDKKKVIETKKEQNEQKQETLKIKAEQEKKKVELAKKVREGQELEKAYKKDGPSATEQESKELDNGSKEDLSYERRSKLKPTNQRRSKN